MQASISNEGTAEVLFEAIVGQTPIGTNQEWDFDPSNPDLANNPFWAVLGTDNGKGIQYLLTDYKRGMRGKGIKSLKVKFDSYDWYILATIG